MLIQLFSRLCPPLRHLPLLVAFPALMQAAQEFRPGEVWLDTAGKPIQAHGGGVLYYKQTYYWYGEDRTPGNHGAVACYSSTNLYDWKREAASLTGSDLPSVDGKPTFVERPKVIYNPRTRKFVMWMHLEQKGYGYSRAGIAISDTPNGHFQFLKAIRPVVNTNAFKPKDGDNQHLYGGTFRDMNLFVDDDGKAYAFYSSEGNWTMYIVRLNADFTGPELPAVENQTWSRVLVRQMREGPAPFKFNGQYHLITSACTGWKPNKADDAVADNIFGPYKQLGNPCIGESAETTYGTQSTSVLALPDHPGKFIFIADEWHPENLPDSRQVWLPLVPGTNGPSRLPWHDRWDLSLFAQKSY